MIFTHYSWMLLFPGGFQEGGHWICFCRNKLVNISILMYQLPAMISLLHKHFCLTGIFGLSNAMKAVKLCFINGEEMKCWEMNIPAFGDGRMQKRHGVLNFSFKMLTTIFGNFDIAMQYNTRYRALDILRQMESHIFDRRLPY